MEGHLVRIIENKIQFNGNVCRFGTLEQNKIDFEAQKRPLGDAVTPSILNAEIAG
jgi:hypothetical protein